MVGCRGNGFRADFEWQRRGLEGFCRSGLAAAKFAAGLDLKQKIRYY
jgi:hypothetical protein